MRRGDPAAAGAPAARARAGTIFPLAPDPRPVAGRRSREDLAIVAPSVEPATVLRRIVERLATATDRESFLADALDLVVAGIGASRALVVLTAGGGAYQVLAARGGGRDLDPTEREEVTRTLIRAVERSGEPQIFVTGNRRSDSSDQLGIVTALAMPIRLGAWRGGDGTPGGILYVDVRDPARRLGDAERELIAAAGSLLGLVAEEVDQRAEPPSAPDERGGEAAVVPLDELLRPACFAAARRELHSCLDSRDPVLLVGESGTGKTLLARALAQASGQLPVVRAALGSSDDLNTIASELFGHHRGAFSGALTPRVGLVEHAAGGTLILDEILDLPRPAQQLLLDFAQFGTYRPLGHGRADPKHAIVRLITITNGDVAEALREGRLRNDLYFRLAIVTVNLPPLRNRREDIPWLADRYLARLDPLRSWRLSLDLRRLLVSEALGWPGNIRQLESVLRRARQRALAADPDADLLDASHVDPRELAGTPSGLGTGGEADATPGRSAAPAELALAWRRLAREREAMDVREREVLTALLQRHGGVVSRVARELGVPRTTLASRLRQGPAASGEDEDES